MADPLYEDKHNTLNTQPAMTGNMVASDGEIYNIVDLLLGRGNYSLGVSGSFTTGDNKTVTVVNGIITSIE